MLLLFVDQQCRGHGSHSQIPRKEDNNTVGTRNERKQLRKKDDEVQYAKEHTMREKKRAEAIKSCYSLEYCASRLLKVSST